MYFLFLCRKTKSSTTRKLHNHKNISSNTSIDQLQSQSLIVHDSQQNNDFSRFYQTTSEKLSEAKRLFSQGLSSYTKTHSSWDQSLKY